MNFASWKHGGIALSIAAAIAGAVAMSAAHDRQWIHGLVAPSLGTVAWATAFLASWTAMTVTMMLPSAIPFIRVAHRLGGAWVASVSATGFALVWTAVGMLAGGALWVSGGGLARLSPGAIETLAGTSLLAAGAYQLSSWSHSCRRHCARPFAIFARRWQSDEHNLQAWRAGIDYGFSCVGCCVPMIVLMILVGMNDLAWMTLLALLMVAQKHVSLGPGYDRTVALVLGVGGGALILGWWSPSLYTLRSLCIS